MYRLSRDVDNSSKEAYVVYSPLANTPINIQPASTEDTVLAQGVFGQTYVGFTTASGILEGDKLIFQKTGEVMMVRGRENWMSPDLLPHVELLLVEFETGE